MQKASRLTAAVVSVVVWIVIGLLTIFYTTAICGCSLLLFPFDRRRIVAHWLATLWGRSIFLCVPWWRVRVAGREHLPPRTALILVSNHQSLFDIMALFCLFRQFKWVSKASLFSIPFLGWSMSLAGYIKLARERHGSIRQTYEQAKRWLAAGVPVLFFPEGTRSRTGQLGPFKNGAFKLALETGVPLVPIVVTGTRELLSRGSWMFRWRARIHLDVLPPIDPARYRHAGPDRFRDDVRHVIEQALQARQTSAD